MSSEPAVHIAIRVNDTSPAVFCTALSEEESDRLAAWLQRNPDLADLVRRARALAEREDDDGGAVV
jgi:hypothetical protein